jgi:hypothetical protein
VALVRRARAVLLAVGLAVAAGGCGAGARGSEASLGARASARSGRAASVGAAGRSTGASRTTPARLTVPLVREAAGLGAAWTVVVSVAGQPAGWAAQRSGTMLLRFDQHLLRLVLHAGSVEPGGSGWVHGSEIEAGERRHVVAGFNGGFKLSYGSVGFMSGGRRATPLQAGLASIVTYRDGSSDIGAWGAGVPSRGRGVLSVLQNLHLLVDHGAPAPTVESCAIECWGATLGGGTEVARSALGVTGEGALVWAGGEHLTPGQLADTLVGAGVQRAVELDINPEWVAGYLYVHRQGALLPAPVVPGQPGIPGQLLTRSARDFFTVLSS